MTAIFSILHAAYDDPESKKVTAVKDKYTEMPMFCIRCAGARVPQPRPPSNAAAGSGRAARSPVEDRISKKTGPVLGLI